MDLTRALTEAAERATADRSPLPAAPLLPRIHRRRALRRGGDALAGVAAAGLVVLGVATLGGGRAAPPPPAATTPVSPVWPAEATACGASVTPGTPSDDGVRLLAALDGPVEAMTLSTQVVNLGERSVRIEAGTEQVLVLAGDRVVARAAGQDRGWVDAGAGSGSRAPVTLTLCDAAGLPDGRYTLVVVATVGLEPTRATVVGEGRPLTLSDGVAASGGTESLQAEVTAALYRRAVGTTPPLPACGEPADGLAPTERAVGLRAWPQPDAVVRPDRSLEDGAAVLLENLGDQPVRDVGDSRLTWVAVRDGRVVGTGSGALGAVTAEVPPHGQVLLGLTAGASQVTDCVTGRPVTGPYDLWLRAEVGVTFGEGSQVDGALVAPSIWITDSPAPVPAQIPLVGEGATNRAGDRVLRTEQTGPASWRVTEAVDGPVADAYPALRTALVAAGYTARDEPSDPTRPAWWRGTFTRPGDTVVLEVSNETGGDTMATWDIATR